MILYFTGTGNSEYAGRRIAKAIGHEVISINDCIKNDTKPEIPAGEALIFAMPVYSWNMPRLVEAWIDAQEFDGQDAYFVITCGGSIGNAAKRAKSLCKRKGLNYRGCNPVVMPENYIALFEAPGVDEEVEIMKKADLTIDIIAARVKKGKALPKKPVGPIGRLGSKASGGFYKIVVKDKKFYADAKCTGCGLCAGVCPLNNITLEDDRPVWNGNCTHCMACICRCPVEAIQYGKKTADKRRYVCKPE